MLMEGTKTLVYPCPRKDNVGGGVICVRDRLF